MNGVSDLSKIKIRRRVAAAAGLLAIAWAGCAFAAYDVSAKVPAVVKKLEGSWQLCVYEPGPAPAFEISDRPSGFISFTSDGRVSLLVSDRTRAKPQAEKPSVEEASKLYRSMLGLAGAFSINPTSQAHDMPTVLTIAVETASDPRLVGTTQQFQFKMIADQLATVRFKGQEGPAMAFLDNFFWKKPGSRC